MAYTTINKPSSYFNTLLYTGTGATQSITGVGFQPDLTWIKNRQDTYNNHLFDVIRGVEKEIRSDSNNAETTISGTLTSFDSDGFTLGSAGNTNFNGNNHVSWNWKANGAGSSNTDGSITSTVSASTTSGFSIVSYTGTGSNATVGHGLGVTPAMVIVKVISASGNNWMVWNKNFSSATDNFLRLNTTASVATISNFWSTSAPNSTTFGIGAGYDNNISGATHIAYCFAEKKGFSKFGSYTGNGNADGTFVYTGFKPAMIIVKDTTGTTENWRIIDNKRLGYNPQNSYLYPSGSYAEATGENVDFVSNGFKARSTDNGLNGSGRTFIYMAFSEHPIVSSSGVPCTAR